MGWDGMGWDGKESIAIVVGGGHIGAIGSILTCGDSEVVCWCLI